MALNVAAAIRQNEEITCCHLDGGMSSGFTAAVWKLNNGVKVHLPRLIVVIGGRIWIIKSDDDNENRPSALQRFSISSTKVCFFTLITWNNTKWWLERLNHGMEHCGLSSVQKSASLFRVFEKHLAMKVKQNWKNSSKIQHTLRLLHVNLGYLIWSSVICPRMKLYEVKNVLPCMFLSRNNLIFVKFIFVIFFFFKTVLLVTSII